MTDKVETVLITGATAGIGLEFARIFHSRGYNLVLTGRNGAKLNRIKEDFNGSRSAITLIQSDLSQAGSAKSVYDRCRADGVSVNILINNAGVGVYGDHTTLNTDNIEQMITLNITSLTTLCGLFGKDMKERKAGYILNVASTAAYQPVPYLASYAASKSYVLNFSESLAKEMKEHNVVVTCLSPGHTDTNFFQNAGIGNNDSGFFAKGGRAAVRKVAEHGIDALFKKKISSIPGLKNNLTAWSTRLASRNIVATITRFRTKNP